MAFWMMMHAPTILGLASAPKAALANGDLLAWQSALEGLRALPAKPADCTLGAGEIVVWCAEGEVRLTPEALPSPVELAGVLREFAIAAARGKNLTSEPHPSTRFPWLEGDEISEEAAETETWDFLRTAVFRSGPMPQGLEFMAAGDAVTTNWLSGKTIDRLIALEAEDGLVATLSAEGSYAAHDVALLMALARSAAAEGAELYLFEPGS
jgi:hypothetical protein